jgi:hypothetical protein
MPAAPPLSPRDLADEIRGARGSMHLRASGADTWRLLGPLRNWWVNQNRTYRHEIAPAGIFSFRDTRIAALGIARSYCYESPKPTEFGTAAATERRSAGR